MYRPGLTESSLLVLASVASPNHGYGVMQEVHAASGGAIDVSSATVYATLERFVADGLVVEVGSEVVNGRNRRYYVMTDAGAAVLEAETARIRRTVAHAARRLRDHRPIHDHSRGAHTG
jgi:PadR family transcriptional regulator PadR